jgi:hypothetical protein
VARAIATNMTNCCILFLATICIYILYSCSNLTSLCVSAYTSYLFGRCALCKVVILAGFCLIKISEITAFYVESNNYRVRLHRQLVAAEFCINILLRPGEGEERGRSDHLVLSRMNVFCIFCSGDHLESLCTTSLATVHFIASFHAIRSCSSRYFWGFFNLGHFTKNTV